MKTTDLNYDQIKHLALRCPIKLKKTDGWEAIRTGNWIAYPAASEVVKRWTRAAKNDLRDREIRGGSYEGDLGTVRINGHLFRLYPKAKALIRQDFATWIDCNADKYLRKDGTPKESTKALHTDDLVPMPVSRHSLAAKVKARDLPKPTTLICPECWNSEYDMKKRAKDYAEELASDRARGVISAITRLQHDQILALCAYRDRNYKASVEAWINVAAWALQAAEYVCNMHAKATGVKELSAAAAQEVAS